MRSQKRDRADALASNSAASDSAAKRVKTEDSQSTENTSDLDDSKKAEPDVPNHSRALKVDAGPMDKKQKAFLIEKIRNAKKVNAAFWFIKVDNNSNDPNYQDIIRHPIDLTMIEHKLKKDEYLSVDDLMADFELMITNTFLFKGLQHAASVSAQSLRVYFHKQMQICPTGETALGEFKPFATKASHKPAAIPHPNPARSVAPLESPAYRTSALLPDGTPMVRRDSTAGRLTRAVVPPASGDVLYTTLEPSIEDVQSGLKSCKYIPQEFRQPKQTMPKSVPSSQKKEKAQEKSDHPPPKPTSALPGRVNISKNSSSKPASLSVAASIPEPEDADPEIAKLEQTIADAQAKLAARKEKNKLQEEYRVLGDEKGELDRRITTASNEFATRHKKLENLEREIQCIGDELEELRTKRGEVVVEQDTIAKKIKQIDESGLDVAS